MRKLISRQHSTDAGRPVHRKKRRVGALLAAAAGLLVLIGTSPAYAADEAPAQWSIGDANGTTRDTPAAADVGGNLVELIRGENNAIWTSVNDGPWRSIGGTTNAAPSLTYWANSRNLYAAHTGTDGAIWYTAHQVLTNANLDNDWHRIAPPAGIRFRQVRPSLAAAADRLFITAVGENERIYYAEMNQNNQLTRGWTEIPGGGRTESGIGSTTTPEGYMIVVHRGTDSRLYFARQTIGTGAWTSWTEVPANGGYASATAPGVTYQPSATYGSQVWITATTSAHVPDVTWMSASNPTGLHGIWTEAPTDGVGESHGGVRTESGGSFFRAANGSLVLFLRWQSNAGGWSNHPARRRL